MKRRLYILVALVLVIAIAFILIAPSLNLPPTALRAWYAAVALLVCIALVGRILVAAVSFQFVLADFHISGEKHFDQDIGAWSKGLLTCALLC